ncbi:MAG: response regulator transcription factor [Rhodothermales bacterium]|nr:response regulator transcription factor [Rhodothermales bacterium]MBO6780099.1 response regulator transcription factor [Rhodothermales bacterium]
MWILVIEDDDALKDLLRLGLTNAGYRVDVVTDGVDGEERARANAYDALVIDWRLPRRDGRAIVQNLRASGVQTPVLILTALDGLTHKVSGLDAGADDFLTKPFAMEELLARLRAVTRRPPGETKRFLAVGDIRLDLAALSASVGDQPLHLRPKEFAVLRELCSQAGVTVSRASLGDRVWGQDIHTTDNVIDVTLSGLRQKLRDSGSSTQLVTQRGVGYRLVPGA